MVKYQCIMMLVLSSLLLSGCWDYADLEDRRIVILSAIDMKEGQTGDMKSGEAIVGGVVLTTFHPRIHNPSRYESFSGQTIAQARERQFGYSPGRYLIGSLQVALIGDEVARAGVDNWLDSYIRDPVVKHNLRLAVTKGRADEVAQFKDPNYENVGEQIKILLEQIEKNGFFVHENLTNYLIDLNTPGKNPVMSLIELQNNKQIACIGSAVFRKDKLVAELGLPETRTLAILRGQHGYGHIPYVIRTGEKIIDRGGIYGRSKRQVKVTRQGDEFFFDIKIKIKGNLVERASTVSLIDHSEQLKAIERAAENQVRRDCYQFIDKMQNDWQLDAIDISRFALAKWRREIEPRVDKDFIQNAHIRVKVEVKIDKFGEAT